MTDESNAAFLTERLAEEMKRCERLTLENHDLRKEKRLIESDNALLTVDLHRTTDEIREIRVRITNILTTVRGTP